MNDVPVDGQGGPGHIPSAEPEVRTRTNGREFLYLGAAHSFQKSIGRCSVDSRLLSGLLTACPLEGIQAIAAEKLGKEFS